jgi:PhnB protein
MTVNPYLTFNGQCEEAFKFYERVLKGKIEGMHTHGNSPMASQVPPDWQDKIMHVTLTVGGTTLMGSDAPPQYYQKPQGFSVSINIADPAEADRVFNELSQNAQVKMPIQKTFWAQRFGMLIDRFDIPWMVNCE